MAAAASGHDASPVGQGLASEGASFRTGALPSFLGRCEPATRVAVNHNAPRFHTVFDAGQSSANELGRVGVPNPCPALSAEVQS